MVSNFPRIAVVGCGRVFNHYLDRWKKSKLLSVLELVALCDTDSDKLKRYSNELNLPGFSSIEELVQHEKFELALVLTPSGSHFSNAKTLLMAGRHVLLEKPSTLLIEHSLELQEIAIDKNLHLGTVHQNRFNHAVLEAKKILLSKRLGEAICASLRLRWHRDPEYYLDDWHGRWESDGGVVSQQGFHHLDCFMFLLGELDRVFSIGKANIETIESDDTTVSCGETKNGTPFTMEFTTAFPGADFEASIEITCQRGFLQIGGIALNELKVLDESSFSESEIGTPSCLKNIVTERFPTGYGLHHDEIVYKTALNISEGISQPVIPFGESIRALRAIHALYRSQEVGGLVYLDDRPISSRLGKK